MKRMLVAVVLLGGCGAFSVQPVKIQPIHITVDVNLHDPDKPGRETGDTK